MKTCKSCGKERELKEYYKHPEMLDGHLNRCKECVKKRVKGYWEDGRGKIVDKRRNEKPERKKWQGEALKRMRKLYREKSRVRGVVAKALKKGILIRQPCQKCGEKAEAHHPDYNKSLEVIWFCSLHHKEWHRNNKAIEPVMK